MTVPFHQYASVPLAISASVATERLRADPVEHLTSATATSLRAVAPAFERLGLSPTGLPAIRARITDAEELGAVEVVWEGDEQLTGWPSLLARLLVAPEEPEGTSRLVLLSPRSPEADLQVAALDRLHRLRVVDVALQCFLHDLAARLDDRTPSEPGDPALHLERAPLFLHHQVATAADPDGLRAALTRDVADLADRATTGAVVRASETLRAGRFRKAAAPLVEGRRATPGELGVIRIGWRSEEEASGWPDMELALIVTAGADGAHLGVLSSREPGYDMSLNRIDRHQRDQLLRQAGAAVVAAVLEEVRSDTATAESGVAERSLAASGASVAR